jgi:1-acyl-sn-glycerol-3-phosphate acyltransferase
MEKPISILPSGRTYALWTHTVFPILKVMLRMGYFSLELSGLENIPPREHLIYVANHSSWLALDGFLVPYALHHIVGEEYLPYGIIHDVLFKVPIVNKFFNHCGAIPVSWVRDLNRVPRHIGSLGIFPEGDEGNSKPFWEAYRMRRWKKGFVKLALNRSLRVLPIAILGLEESMPAAFTVKFLRSNLGTVVGCPLFPFPLPSHLKMIFCKPVDLTGYLSGTSKETKDSHEVFMDISEKVQSIVQTTLDLEMKNRPLARFSKWMSERIN